jgi:cystathionine gamma-synthase
MTFTSEVASRVFFDTLECAKGPSLGTNFTLASPYALLAHYYELDWAAQYGVEKDLVRVSVGLEDYEPLRKAFESALDAAEKAQADALRA